MLAPRRPRRASSTPLPARAPGARPSGDRRREEQFLTWLAELVHLTEMEGRATARLWFERLRKPDGLPRSSSDRQWERLKIALVEHGVPHVLGAVPATDEVEAPGACTVRVTIGKSEVDRFAQRRKKCAAATCGKWFPPRTPFFHRNPERPDGLSRRCADCERAARVERHRRGLTEGVDPEKLERRRASARVAMAKRRAMLLRVGRPEDRARAAVRLALKHGRLQRPKTCSRCEGPGPIQAHHHAGYDEPNWLNVEWLCLSCHGRTRHAGVDSPDRIMSSETPRGLAGDSDKVNGKDHAGGVA